MIDTTADFAAAAADFGPASVTLGGVAVEGLLVEPPAMALGMVAGTAPEFHVTAGAVPEDPRTVQLVADGTTWNVADWRDDAGVVVLTLERP